MEAFDEVMARKTVKRYACSICWGELEIVPAIQFKDKYYVICKKCGDETRGYVTKYFVDRRRGESKGEERDVTRLLIKTGILQNPYEEMTVSDLISQMGF